MNRLARAWRAAGLLMLSFLLIAPAGCLTVPPDCHSEEVICLGFVTDQNGLRDYGLNEQAWQTLQALREQGFVVDVIESIDAFDYAKNVAYFADHGYDLVFTSGYTLTETTHTMAEKYPQTSFVMLGQPPSEDAPPNLAGVLFPEAQAGFLAGAAAAILSESGKIAAIFANPELPSVKAYAGGFQGGAGLKEVEVFVVAHEDARFADSLNDREWGVRQADTLDERGADVLFAYGGGTGLSALEQFRGRVIGAEVDFGRRYPSMQKRLIASIFFDLSIINEIAQAGGVTQSIYEGTYQILWGEAIDPTLLESLPSPEEVDVALDEALLSNEDLPEDEAENNNSEENADDDNNVE